MTSFLIAGLVGAGRAFLLVGQSDEVVVLLVVWVILRVLILMSGNVLVALIGAWHVDGCLDVFWLGLD